MSEQPEIDRLLEVLTPEGQAHPEVHFYAARPKTTPRFQPPPSLGKARSFLLDDAPWVYQVDLFEVTLPLTADELPGTLLQGLEDLVAQGAPLAWLMFDAAFDGLSSLTTEWGAKNVYGIAGRDVRARLALGEQERTEQAWIETVAQAVRNFDQR